MTAERDRLRIQRDTFTKQFEELSKTRSTDIEGVFEKYKEKAGLQAKGKSGIGLKGTRPNVVRAIAQNDIISSLTESNEKLQARAQTLEKALAAAKEASTTLPSAGGVFEAAPAPAKADPKEVKALKEELAKAQAALKEKDEKSESLQPALPCLLFRPKRPVSSLERECKAEVEHSRSLQAAAKSGPAASLAASVSTTPEEADKDSQSLKLYEDMTDLNIMNVKIKSGGKNGKEVTFNCVQTVEGRSASPRHPSYPLKLMSCTGLNFKLRAYNELDPELVAVKSDNPWVKSVVYQPISLEYETDTDFIKRLGIFASEFSVRKEQLGVLWENLKSRISVNGVLEDMEG